MRSFLLALIPLCFLTACDSTASLKDLRAATPTSDPYQTALAAEYRAYAEEKLADCDWWASKYFADKGLMAAYGRDVEPEDPGKWHIPAEQQAEFAGERAKLMDAVAVNRTTDPAGTAHAVVAYDRWVEVTDAGWNLPRMGEAHDDVANTLASLTPNGMPVDAAALATPHPVESTSTVLYFPFDSDALTASAQAALSELVSYIQQAGNVQVTINGHADRVGSDSYNMALSEHRARFVMAALAQAGVPGTEMQYFAFGETDPAVPTPDGVAEPKNRRVEIFLE